MSQTPKVRFIEHKGRNVLFIDLSGIRDRPTVFHTIEEVRALVTAAERSLLTLTSVAGSSFDRGIIQALKELALHNKPFVTAAALVGVWRLQRVAHAAVSLCSPVATCLPFMTSTRRGSGSWHRWEVLFPDVTHGAA